MGFLTWVESFNDTTTEAGQIKALANFTKFKYPIDTTVLQLRKGLLDSLAVWGTITGNDKSDRVKLDSFYKATRDKFPKQPDSHPIVRVRAKIADFIYDNSPMLKNAAEAKPSQYAAARGASGQSVAQVALLIALLHRSQIIQLPVAA